MMATAISYHHVWSRKPHWLAGELSCGSHHVVPSAGAGGLAGQLRGVLLLSEGLLVVPGAAVPTSHLAHPVLVVAFLVEPGALVYVELANAHLNSRVAGYVATPSDELLILILLRHQRSLHILLCQTLRLDRHHHCFLDWWWAWGLIVHPRVRLIWQLWHRGSVWLAHLWKECWSSLRRVFRVRRRWCWGVTYHLFIVRKLAVVPESWKSANTKALAFKPSSP